jgi:hypothetical protein
MVRNEGDYVLGERISVVAKYKENWIGGWHVK